MQFRGWSLKSDLDNFLEARILGQGVGTNNPLLGDLLGAGLKNPGVWFGVGDSSDFLAASHLDEATLSLLRESFVTAQEDPSLADPSRSAKRDLVSCGPSFNVACPSDTSLPFRDFPPFALSLLEGLKTHMGAPPTFEVEGIFWQTFAASPNAGGNPRCSVCEPPPPTSSLTGTPAQGHLPIDSPPYGQRTVHQPYAAALHATHSTQAVSPEAPTKSFPQVPRPEQRPHSSVVVDVWGENLPSHPTDLRKRNDLRGHMAHGNVSRDMGSFAPPPTLAPAYGLLPHGPSKFLRMMSKILSGHSLFRPTTPPFLPPPSLSDRHGG